MRALVMFALITSVISTVWSGGWYCRAIRTVRVFIQVKSASDRLVVHEIDGHVPGTCTGIHTFNSAQQATTVLGVLGG